MSIRNIGFGILLASGIFMFSAARAQWQHPYCLHALSELTAARALLLQHIHGQPMAHNEKEALVQINMAIKEINEAFRSSGRELMEQPKPHADHGDAANMRQCIDLIKKAKINLSHENQDFDEGLQGIRDRSMKNCDDAIRFVKQASHKALR